MSRLHAVAMGLVLVVSACGGDGVDAPYTPPPPDCPEADDYLQPLYGLVDAGRLERLARAVREQVPEEARRDLVDALLRLLGTFEDGSFAGLAALPPDDGGSGLQLTLGRLVRWIAETGPGAPYTPLTRMLGRALATCEGEPVFRLLAEAVADPALLSALGDLLGSDDLMDALAGLDFEGANGRAALQYLVRNLLVSASSPAFSVERVLDLIDLLVDLDAPPYDGVATALRGLLDADGLPRLQGLLVCLGDVDPTLELGGFLYDLLTSGLVGELLDAAGGAGELLPEPIRRVLVQAVEFLADDARARRQLVPALLVLLADDVAPGVLGDVASLLEAEALGGLVQLVTDLATRSCR